MIKSKFEESLMNDAHQQLQKLQLNHELKPKILSAEITNLN